MPSLIAFLGLDGSKFKAGLDKATADAQKAAPTIEKSLIGRLKDSGIVSAIASPVGAAMGLLTGFAVAVGAKLHELEERAKEIKRFTSLTNFDSQKGQTVLYAAQGAGVGEEGIAKSMVKIAEAQEKVKSGASGSAEALKAFNELGVSLKDIQTKDYKDIWLGIAESMKVAQLSGEQLSAGATLMGKTFEGLQPMFKRGFNDPVDQMKQLTDDELKRLNNMNRSTAVLKAVWGEALQSIATGGVKLLGLGGKKVLGDEDIDAAAKKLQEKANARDAERAKKQSEARAKELKDKENAEKNQKAAQPFLDQAEAEREKAKLAGLSKTDRATELARETVELEKHLAILRERLKTEKDLQDLPAAAKISAQIEKNKAEMDAILSGERIKRGELHVNANQAIGAYASLNSANLPTQMLSVAQRQENLLKDIRDRLPKGGVAPINNNADPFGP